MKILSFYPIHRSWINSIAELFPEHSFELIENKKIPCGPIERKLWLGEIVPFVSNVKIVGEYGKVDHRNYDLILAWQNVYSSILAKHKWVKPVVLFIHNAGDRPPAKFKGPIVYNTYLSAEQAGDPTAPVYLGVRKASEIGEWTGEIPRGCVGNLDLLAGRRHVIDANFVGKLVSAKLIEQIQGNLAWKDFITIRRKLRFNLEVLQRANCNSFLESMRMGQPCIAPDIRDYNKFITHGDNGFLYKTENDIESIARKLNSDYDYTKQIGLRAKETIETHIDDEKRRKILEKVFEKALEDK